MSPTARHLCLHYVSDAARPPRLAITRAQLAAIVERERARGTAAACSDVLDGALAAEQFTISFDDAHRSVLSDALPVLSALGVRATLFVPTAYIGTAPDFLDWDGLRALRDAGWGIGAHTERHPRMSWRLYDETEDAYRARLFAECARSRERIERALGVECSVFAYPYGESPEAARDAVKRAGFRAAFTVRDSVEWDGDAWTIPRLDGMEAHGWMTPRTTEPVPFSVVIPARDRSAILGQTLRRLSQQTYPEDRFEVIVVDDQSREDLRAVVPDDARFRVLALPMGDGRFRAGQARQAGAAAARFSHLAFLDGDVFVGKDFLWHLDWVHARVPDCALLGYLSGYNLHDLGHLHTPDSLGAVEDLEAIPRIIPDRSREPTLRACLDNVDWLTAAFPLCYTGNLSLPRALLERIGGFSDAFVGWGLEDVDLGARLEQAGARFVFSRFAVGWHVVDPAETQPRNPFRRLHPTHEDFGGFLQNLSILAERHAGSDAVQAFVARTRADVDETCGRPRTVGLELGGASSLALPFHRVLHRIQPGGVTTEEALDRVAYAQKVGAKNLYILGGEPAEHPGFLAILAAAKQAELGWIAAQTHVLAFAEPGLAERARDAGLQQAVAIVLGFDEARFDALTGVAHAFERFERGLEALLDAEIHVTARVVVTRDSLDLLPDTLAELARRGLTVDEVSVVAPLSVEDVIAPGHSVVACTP